MAADARNLALGTYLGLVNHACSYLLARGLNYLAQKDS